MDENDPCMTCEHGHYRIEPDGICACHITPPCAACLDAKLICDTCGDEAPE